MNEHEANPARTPALRACAGHAVRAAKTPAADPSGHKDAPAPRRRAANHRLASNCRFAARLGLRSVLRPRFPSPGFVPRRPDGGKTAARTTCPARRVGPPPRGGVLARSGFVVPARRGRRAAPLRAGCPRLPPLGAPRSSPSSRLRPRRGGHTQQLVPSTPTLARRPDPCAPGTRGPRSCGSARLTAAGRLLPASPGPGRPASCLPGSSSHPAPSIPPQSPTPPRASPSGGGQTHQRRRSFRCAPRSPIPNCIAHDLCRLLGERPVQVPPLTLAPLHPPPIIPLHRRIDRLRFFRRRREEAPAPPRRAPFHPVRPRSLDTRTNTKPGTRR